MYIYSITITLGLVSHIRVYFGLKVRGVAVYVLSNISHPVSRLTYVTLPSKMSHIDAFSVFVILRYLFHSI